MKFLKECLRLKLNDKKLSTRIFITLAIITAVSLFLGVCVLFMSVQPFDWHYIKMLITDFRIIILNSIPLFLFIILFWFVFGKLWISFSITGALAYIVCIINANVMTIRDRAFVFEDIFLAVEAGTIIDNYSIYFPLAYVVILMIMILCATVLFFINLNYNNVLIFSESDYTRKSVTRNKLLIRIIGTFISIILFILSLFRIYYNNNIYEALQNAEFKDQWKESDKYASRGTLYSFLRSSYSSFGVHKPEGYSEAQAKNTLSSFKNVGIPDNKKFNIIAIMLEAYNDFSQFENIDFEVDPYVNFHRLQNESYSGKLYTKVFGGNTIETERSFLTGYSDIEIKNKDTNSFVRYFKSQGYYTEAMHPSYGWFYNRDTVNYRLGFDNFLCYENKFGSIPENSLETPLYCDMLSDYDFFNYIIEGYENAASENKKYFNFSVTYQNHGAYLETPCATDYYKNVVNLSEKNYNIFNNYLSGIYKTDIAIEKLRNYIDNSNEPIVLILFGDHNPSLGDFSEIYQLLGINTSLETPDGSENYYCTPYLFYANSVAKKTIGKDFCAIGNTISPDNLIPELFDYIEFSGSQYLNYLISVKNNLSVINPNYIKSNGKYYRTDDFPDKNILNSRESIEYYIKTQKLSK